MITNLVRIVDQPCGKQQVILSGHVSMLYHAENNPNKRALLLLINLYEERNVILLAIVKLDQEEDWVEKCGRDGLKRLSSSEL